MKKQKLNTTQVILIGGFAFILVVVCVIGVLLIRSSQSGDTQSVTDVKKGSSNLVIDESNLQEIQNQFEEAVGKGMFEVNMNTIWNFPNGNVASEDAFVANGHVNSLPMSFEILVDEEVVYTSTVIPVGNQIKEIVLDKPLAAGNYAAVCMYHLWNEDGTEDSSFGVNITISVKE